MREFQSWRKVNSLLWLPADKHHKESEKQCQHYCSTIHSLKLKGNKVDNTHRKVIPNLIIPCSLCNIHVMLYKTSRYIFIISTCLLFLLFIPIFATFVYTYFCYICLHLCSSCLWRWESGDVGTWWKKTLQECIAWKKTNSLKSI